MAVEVGKGEGIGAPFERQCNSRASGATSFLLSAAAAENPRHHPQKKKRLMATGVGCSAETRLKAAPKRIDVDWAKFFEGGRKTKLHNNSQNRFKITWRTSQKAGDGASMDILYLRPAAAVMVVCFSECQ
jgi:hypothetical protein